MVTATMTCSVRVCLLMGAVFLLQEVGAVEKEITELLNMVSDKLDNVRQLINKEQTPTDLSNENHKQIINETRSQPNVDSAILRAISPLRQAFQEEKSFHRKNYYKLETDMSRLETDIGSLITDTKQVMAEVQKLVQGLEEVRKEQAALKELEEVRKEQAALKELEEVRMEQALLKELEKVRKEQAALSQTVKENKQFGTTLNQSMVANSQKTEGLVQRVEDLKQAVDDAATKAVDLTLNKYKPVIEEAVESREKCQSGDWVGPHSANPSYPFIQTVQFQPPFKETPALVYGLKALDSQWNTNVRMMSSIEELTNTHFKIRINPWHNTVIFGAVFSRMACPK